MSANTSSGPASSDHRNVYIYIDNSNLWIQGQKTYAERKGQTVKFDPTWRFDVGRLKDILTRNYSRPRDSNITFNVKVQLYGSTPPPVDTVWEAIKFHDVKVSTFARSTWTGREKQVDQEIGLDSALQAESDKNNRIQSEFVIISGDRDLYSAVLKIVQRGFPVHVWSWKNCLASVYIQQEEKLVQVHLLDEYLEEIGFRETTFRVERDTISPHSIVVLDPLPKSDEINKFVSRLSTPVYRYVWATKRAHASSHDLIIIPAFARRMEHHDLVKLFETTKAELEPCGLGVLTYQNYCQNYLSDSPKDELAISNRFRELPEDAAPGGNEDSKDNNGKEDYDDDGFTEVNRRSEQQKGRFKRDEQKSRTPCMWGYYCKNPLDCKYGHTKHHEDYFKSYGPKKAEKYRLCMDKGCIRGERCRFAHGMEKLLCPTCDGIGVGHEIGGCIPR